MFYDETTAVKSCEEEPSLIFEMIKEGHHDLVDYILTKKKVNINTTDQEGNDILQSLLKKGWYDLVEKHMKNKEWDVNHQNRNGDTFAHILVTIKYLDIIKIINQLLKNNKFIPNIRNKKGETILDRSINEKYIYTTVKILEDKRFNNIDLISIKKLYDSYIKNNNYGTYSKLNNLEIIVDNFSLKDLLPTVNKLLDEITENIDKIKEQFLNNKLTYLDSLINNVFEK